jgi:hypothetical protein
VSLRARAGLVVLVAAVAGASVGAWLALRPRSRGYTATRVGGHKNACCCTQRIEPEDP